MTTPIPPHGEKPLHGWDYVLCLPAPTSPPDPPAPTALLTSLRHAGFSYTTLSHPTKPIHLLLLSLPPSLLLQKAEEIGLELPLLPSYGAGYHVFTVSTATNFSNHQRLHAGLSYFTPGERLHIIQLTLSSRGSWAAGLNFRKLQQQGVISSHFALHSPPEQRVLLREAVFRNWWRPILRDNLSDLKDYFGARVTRYLAWLAFYAKNLPSLAILAVIVTVLFKFFSSERVLAAVRIAFGVGLCFWGAYWFDLWKRRNAVLNVLWGLDDFYEDVQNEIRPAFRGVETKGFYCEGGFVNLQDMSEEGDGTSWPRRVREGREVLVVSGSQDPDFLLEAPVTGQTFPDLPEFPYSSHVDLKRRIYVTGFVTLFFALVVGVLSFMILFYKHGIMKLFGKTFGNYAPGVATALLISVSDSLWRNASIRLTEWENHRNVQPYENSLIMKRFAFQFVSNYISLFYIAFVKPFTPSDPCIIGPYADQPDCMAELGAQISSILITKATTQQVMEIGVPFITLRFKEWMRLRAERRAQSDVDEDERSRLLPIQTSGTDETDEDRILHESTMAPYTSTMGDYGEAVIQHGFLVLFGMAFPLAAVINTVNHAIECRTDTYKYLAQQQRPDAGDSGDIGSWLKVLGFLSTVSIMTTAALLTITTPALQRALPDSIGDWMEKYPAFSFVVFEHLLLGIRWIVSFTVSDVPSSTYRFRARQDFLLAKCLGVGMKNYFEGNTENGPEES